MKTLTLLALLALSTASFGETFECSPVLKKDGTAGRRFIPTNDAAKKLARELRVKTCTGDRFQTVAMAEGNNKTVGQPITKEQQRAIYKEIVVSESGTW